MKRHVIDAADQIGLNGFDGVAYEFTSSQIETIRAASDELHMMCLRAIDAVIADSRMLRRFGIPEFAEGMVVDSWHRGDPYVYGRLDLGFNPMTNEVKLIEYNGDTPTLLVEAGRHQQGWLGQKSAADKRPYQQFNTVEHQLLHAWLNVAQKIKAIDATAALYMSAAKEGVEEKVVVAYMREMAQKAGMQVQIIDISDVGLIDNATDPHFVDLKNRRMYFWLKMYPWEWLLNEAWGRKFPALTETMGVIEPPWKMLLSNKALLPILWKLFPGHPNLLPSFFHQEALLGNKYVRKPTLSRCGEGIRYVNGDQIIETDATEDSPSIYQGLFEAPTLDGHHAQIGSWIINGEPAGMIVREDTTPIIARNSRIAPHFYSP